MNKWMPISKSAINDLINKSESLMSSKELRYWEKIKTTPAKWEAKEYESLCGGFWVVGIIGSEVIWFNDIEDGFNVSSYSSFGEIDEYWCNQESLQDVINIISYDLEHGN